MSDENRDKSIAEERGALAESSPDTNHESVEQAESPFGKVADRVSAPVEQSKTSLQAPDTATVPAEASTQSLPTNPIPESTVNRSTYKRLVIGVVIALIAVSFLGGYVLGQNTGKPYVLENFNPQQTNSVTPTQSPSTSAQQNGKVFVSYQGSPIRGDQNAPVTIVEFSDFQCPFCGSFFSNTLPTLEQNYINPGKVRLVYRDFPLESIHPNAVEAALAAQCANEQNKFWQYHDTLFSNQAKWAGLNSGNVTVAFEQFAVQMGLNADNFNNCLGTAKYLKTLEKNFQDGSSYGVTGTPTFFIGNDKEGYVQLVGAQPYSVFEQAIDKQLH